MGCRVFTGTRCTNIPVAGARDIETPRPGTVQLLEAEPAWLTRSTLRGTGLAGTRLPGKRPASRVTGLKCSQIAACAGKRFALSSRFKS